MVNTLIDPRDEMYRYSVASLRGNEEAGRRLYFEKGRQISDAVLQIADRRPGGRQGVRSFLDFASGYGRATRFLTTSWPASTITVCDIQVEGVAFQESNFGVIGVASASDPSALFLDRDFELAFAASFFSHVPPSSFERWLLRLSGFLGHNGTLVISTNSLSGRPDVDGELGVHFEATSESEVLSGEEYGTTWVAEEYVRSAAGAAGFASEQVVRLPRGLCGHQDLWVLQRGETIDLSGFAGYPAGDVSRFETRDGVFHIEGWAEDWRPAGVVESISLEAEGRCLAASLSPLDKKRRVSWSLDMELAAFDLDQIISISARNDQGRSNLIALGSLRPFVEG